MAIYGMCLLLCTEAVVIRRRGWRSGKIPDREAGTVSQNPGRGASFCAMTARYGLSAGLAYGAGLWVLLMLPSTWAIESSWILFRQSV